MVECFVCYLAGHNRPVHEVLFSRDQDMSLAFQNEFAGLTMNPVTLEELQRFRRTLKKELPASLAANHRQFLFGLVMGEPDWTLMNCPHLSQLPCDPMEAPEPCQAQEIQLGQVHSTGGGTPRKTCRMISVSCR